MKTYSIRQLFDDPVVTLKDVMLDWDGDLRWESYLDLENTQITELPDNLEVGGSLGLQGSSITKLPSGLIVHGYLDLRNTQITELPDDLKVRSLIYVSKGQLTYIPEHLKGQVYEE